MAIKNQCTTLLVVLIITLMVTGGFGSTLIAKSYNASSIKTEKLNNDDEVNILGNENNPITNTITFNSTSPDGYIYAFGSDYSEVWNNNGNSATIEDTLDFINMGQFSLNDVLVYIYRAYLFFDTSSLPDDAVIASATLSLYGKSGTAWDFYIRIQNGQPTYPHNPIDQGDYDRTYYSGNGGQFYTSGWSTSGYNDISLNSNGTIWINKQGTTKLCLRSSKEINGIPPLFNINEVISFYSYEKGNDYRPKLAVEYTIPNNPPNTPSKPSGPESGEVGELLTYSTSATDPDGDQVRYKFDWGDGNQSDWTDWVDSGQSASESYSWNAPSTYHIKAKAQDTPGDESEWSLPLTVTITESSGPPIITGVKTYYADGSEISGGDGLLLQGMDLDNIYTAYVSGYNIEWVQFELGFQEHTDYDGTDGWTATFNSIDIIDPNAVLTITAHNILGEDTKEYHPKIIPMVGWLVNFVDYVTNYNDTEFVSFSIDIKENPPKNYNNHWVLNAGFDFSIGEPESPSESPVNSTVPEPGVDIDDVGGDYGYTGGIGSSVSICSDGTIDVSGEFKAEITAKSLSGKIGAILRGSLTISDEIIWESMNLTINGEVTIPIFYIPLQICGIGIEAGVDITPHVEITLHLDPTDDPSQGIVPGLGIKIKEDEGIKGNVGAMIRAYCEAGFVIGDFYTEAGGDGTLFFKTPPNENGYFENFELSCWIGGRLRLAFWEIEGWWTYNWSYSEGRLSDKEYTETDWASIEREYLNPDHGSYNTFVWNESSNSGTIVENVFPHARPCVAYTPGSYGSEAMIVWSHDNNSKPKVKGMEIQYTKWKKSGKMDESKTIPATNDDRLQMDPQIAFDKNGNLVCVFIQTDNSISEYSNAMDAFDATEIAYCILDKNSETWSNIVTLTSNNRMDVSPVLTSNENGDVVLIWCSDNDNDHTTIGDRSVYATFWNGNSWSDAINLANNKPVVSTPRVAIKNDNNAICVFAMDGDNNIGTAKDQNIFYIAFDSGGSGYTEQFTYDDLYQHTSPSVVYGKDGNSYIIWLKNEYIEYESEEIYEGTLYYCQVSSKADPIKITNGVISDPVALQFQASGTLDDFNFAVGWCGGKASNKLYTAEIKLDDSIDINEIYSSESKLSETYWNFASKSYTAAVVERPTLKNDGKNCYLSFIFSTGYAPDPNPKLVKPKKQGEGRWWCYFRDKPTWTYPIVFIIGKITIEVEDNPFAVDKVVFYIDNHVQAVVTEPNEKGVYSWTWNERIFFGHIIKIESHGSNGNVKKYSLIVFIMNFFPQSYGR